MYEKLMYGQLYDYFGETLSPCQCGFRKGCSTQDGLLAMLKKKYESVGKGTDFGALLTDLSKEFYFIDPKLLIAKIILVLESHLRHLI